MTVTCELKDSWKQFLELVEKKCSSTEFHNWFSPIKVIPKDGDILHLEVPNIFVQEYLTDNYRDDLALFFPDLENGKPPIEFHVKQDKKPQKKQQANPIQKNTTFLLNKNYTFENFIEGPSNQFVKSAAIGVAAHPGKSYNPLFIHGGVGLGKTHLLHGIGHTIKNSSKNIRVQCITTEAFINDLIDNLKSKSVDKMKRYYRSLDILLVDDIQFLQNRLNFEDEFCNTFEALINQHRQIVITSDKPPSQLNLSERMIARMEWGLVANVGIPDLETRVAIVQHKADQKGLFIPSDIAFYIAEHIYLNVRQIEGAINRICAFCRLMNLKITQDIVERVLAELIHKNPSIRVTIDGILKSVSNVFEVKTSDIKGDSRMKNIALARQVAMYLAKELMDDSLQKIAASFGGKTHSTLLHAWKKIAKELKENEKLNRQVQIIKRNLKG